MKEKFCSTCGEEFKPGESSVRCSLCMCNYHASCWEKAGGCTTWGCPGNSSEKIKNDNNGYKKCPNCGERLVDFASKCRYCRADIDHPSGELKPLPKKKKRVKRSLYRKDPILTALLNLVFPGAGYMYLGRFSTGLMWFVIAVAAWFFTRGIGLIAVYLWVIYDSSRHAVIYNRDNKSGPEQMEGF